MKISSRMILFKVAIHKNYKDNLLNHLSKINTVHIKSKSISQFSIKLGDESLLIDKIKNLKQNADSLFKKLKLGEFDFHELKIEENEKIEFVVKDFQELINHTSEEINFYANRINELERYIARATIELEHIKLINECYKFLEKFNLNRFCLGFFNQLNFKIFTTFSKNLPNLKTLFEFSIFPNVYQTSYISNDRIVFFTIYPKDKEDDLKERIRLIHAEEVQILKKYLTYDGINFTRISKEFDYLKNTLSKYNLEVTRIRNDNLLKFAAINEIIQNIEEYNWVQQQFENITPTRLMLRFFIPSNKKQEVEGSLEEDFKGKITIESIDISKKRKTVETKIEELRTKIKRKERRLKEGLKSKVEQDEKEEIEDKGKEEDLREEAPTVMRNNFLIRPFETLTRLYGTPTYSEIDPTIFIAITFPLLFGLMFGDIGHGLCLVIAGLIGAIVYRKRKGTDLYNMCWIIFYCGWGSILGGFLYGDFFGTHEIAILGIELTPVKIGNFTLHNPLDNIMTVFIFAIIVGVIHINLGWFIQGMNYMKQSRKYLAFSDSFCKIALLIGGTLLIFMYRFDINSWFIFPYPILWPLVPGLLLIILKPFGRILRVSYLKEESYGELVGEGSIETFETVISVMSNVASYIRILALALAHIALMIAIQAMVGLIRGEGIFIQILIVIGLILGNLVVILLEGLLVFLNDLRLHFYEFFFKFYQGSGTEFFPFFLDSNYSVIIFAIPSEKDVISEEIEREISVKKDKENIERAVSYISDKYLD